VKAFPISASDEDLKSVIRLWIACLAAGRYDEALELTWPVVLRGSGSLDHREVSAWTAPLLEAVINNYGLPEPLECSPHKFTVAPVDATMQEAFEKQLNVDRQYFKEFDQEYVGTVHVDLPLVYQDRVALSDLTARFYLCPVSESAIALILLDIHVL
jgi:hypothetical protein